MKVIRLGIVGTGIAARNLHMPALERLKDRIRVVSVFNHHRPKAERFAEDFRIPRVASSLREILKDPGVDAVLMALPIHLNPKMGLSALRAGKPCLCEKPLAHTLSAGRSFAGKASRYRTPFLVMENYVFDPKWEAFLEAVRKKIGKPRFFELRILSRMDVRNPYARTKWRQHPRHLGGFLGDAGVHFAAVMRRAFGEPRKVTSRVLSLRPELPPVDTMFDLMEFPGGVTGHVAYSFSIDSDIGTMWNVYGTKGKVQVVNDRVLLTRGRTTREIRYPKTGSFEAMHRHYHAVLTARCRPRYTWRDGLKDLRLVHRMLGGLP